MRTHHEKSNLKKMLLTIGLWSNTARTLGQFLGLGSGKKDQELLEKTLVKRKCSGKAERIPPVA
jgi:hypothetical protein